MFASPSVTVPAGGSSRPTPLECRALTEMQSPIELPSLYHMMGKHVQHHLMSVEELKPQVASWGESAQWETSAD